MFFELHVVRFNIFPKKYKFKLGHYHNPCTLYSVPRGVIESCHTDD